MTESAQATQGTAVRLAQRGASRVASVTLGAKGAILVAFCVVLWTAVVAMLAVRRHSAFLSHRFDLGNVTQTVWSSAHGRLLDMTLGTGEQAPRLASHVDPALLLFVPLWWIHADPATLIVAQALALAAGVYPVLRLAAKYVQSQAAVALLGAWYLTFPWLLWNAFNDVHAVTLAIPLLLYAIWSLDEGRLGRFAVFGGLALLTGELVGLTLAAIGVWYAVRYRQRLVGLAIALTSAAWTATCLLLIIPAFNDGPNRFYNRFESVGGSPSGLLETLFTDPGALWAAATTQADISYVILLLLPTAFVALGEPLLLAAIAPQLGLNVLSDFWSTTQPMFQYVAPLLPPLFVASILAVARVPGRGRVAVAGAMIGASLACLAAKPPIPGEQDFLFAHAEPAGRTAAMRDAIDLVPANAPVTSTNRLGAHLSERRTIYLFPERAEATWAVLDTRDPWLQVGGEQVDEALFNRLLVRFERDPRWRKVFDRADVRVYRKAP